MTTLKMDQYGEDLSGRELGKKIFQEIIKKHKCPLALDFSKVGSIGSSFADEVVAEIARMQKNNVQVINANRVVKSCLMDVAEDKNVEIEFISRD